MSPQGGIVEQAVEHIWPDTDPKLVHRQFWTAASNCAACCASTSRSTSRSSTIASVSRAYGNSEAEWLIQVHAYKIGNGVGLDRQFSPKTSVWLG